MNAEQAKFILSSGRRDARHASDLVFAEALRELERDPALAAWFERASAHDHEVACKLATIAPPPGLREAILAGGRASARRRRFRVVRVALACAAALAIALSAWRWSAGGPAPTDLAQFALTDAARGWVHSHTPGVQAEFEHWLASGGGRAGLPLPDDLEQLRAAGCRTIDVGGRDVFEICFRHEGRWLHLYAMRMEPPDSRAATDRVAMVQAGHRRCATWSDAARGYHVALVGSSESPVFSGVL